MIFFCILVLEGLNFSLSGYSANLCDNDARLDCTWPDGVVLLSVASGMEIYRLLPFLTNDMYFCLGWALLSFHSSDKGKGSDCLDTGERCLSIFLSLLCRDDDCNFHELLLGSLGFLLRFGLPSLLNSKVCLPCPILGVITALLVVDYLPKSNFLFLVLAQVVLETVCV